MNICGSARMKNQKNNVIDSILYCDHCDTIVNINDATKGYMRECMCVNMCGTYHTTISLHLHSPLLNDTYNRQYFNMICYIVFLLLHTTATQSINCHIKAKFSSRLLFL